MLLVGLTGNIGSGKSTVAQHAVRTRCDDHRRRCSRPARRRARHPGVRRRSSRGGGTRCVRPDGHLDRAALRRVVFADQAQLEELNEIVHPEVERLRDHARRPGARSAATESSSATSRCSSRKHMADRFDRIILVDAPRPIRLERLVHDRGLRETEAMEMIAAQMPAELKRARADFILENGGTLTHSSVASGRVGLAAASREWREVESRDRSRSLTADVDVPASPPPIDSARDSPSPTDRSTSCPIFRKICSTPKSTNT